MITLILAETTQGQIRCTVKGRGLILIQQETDSWDKALEWARAIVADPPDRPATRTRYQTDADDPPGGGA